MKELKKQCGSCKNFIHYYTKNNAEFKALYLDIALNK